MNPGKLKGKYFLTEAEIKSYNDNGFILLEGVLSREETDYYREVIDNIVETRTGNDRRQLNEKSPYEREFLQCGHLWSEFDEVKSLTLSPRLGSIAKQLLNSEHIRLWHDQALYKLPGGDATEPHQDLAYWPMLDRNAGTIWIALDEVTIEMGAMQFVPGSHSIGLNGYHHRIEDSIDGKINLLDIATKKVNKKPVSYNLKPGDATFHHGLTVHFTKENNSGKIRKGMTVIYYADGVRFDGNSPASGHFCAAGSEHGQPIATKRNPVII